MAVKPIAINKFDWWLNLTTGSNIGDNQFVIAKNVYYNVNKQLETRRWYIKFGAAVGSAKWITSYFFTQRDDTGATMALCASGTDMYKYDPTDWSWDSIKSWLTEYETMAGKTTWKTRRDFATYKNTIYMCNWVDSYASFDWYTPAFITGSSTATSVVATWTAISDGSFKISNLNGAEVNVTGINFTSGVTTMDNVATKIQTALRAVTSKLETVTRSTDHFIVSSADTTSNSSIYYIQWWSSGTSIHTLMDCYYPAVITPKARNPTYTEYPEAPRIRYINMNTDTLFGSWEDINPITFYYSESAPTDWSSFYANSVVVGWDEMGRINGQNELGQVILAFKSGKIYSIDVTNEKALPIDSQTGGFSDRTIANVGNSLVYLTERGVDTLKPRTWLDGSTALESSPLDEDVRELTNKITELQLNANAWRYIKRLNNYYITFDTNNDNIPDTTLVYNSLVKAWTQYDYPSIYDYGMYITADWEYKHLFTSAITDQVYEMESGFDDDWITINYEIQTKAFDFGEPGTFKTFEYVDIIGQKSKWTEIPVKIYVWDELVGWATIDDTKIINNTTPSQTLGTRPIWVDGLTGDSEDDVPMYSYLIRVPLYSTWQSISVNMSSEWGIWMLEKMRIWVNWEPIDVFSYANIG